MTALARDVRGATLAMMAASLVPLAGMIGGGLDLARMYITKTRLQHACDAGALAGRKAMGGGQWSQDSNKPNSIARTFFAANYKAGSFGSSDLTYGFSESSGKVTGTAQATLPMTLTRVIGQTTANLGVTCEAEMRLPNTDVMFVLDNTGSMAQKAKSTDTQVKIDALKSAVKCFYEILARLDTTETCVGDAPSGGTSSEVQIRFGFVPYDMNVNVGRLLPSNWFADKWTYQSRIQTTVTGIATGYSDATPTVWSAWSTNKSMTTTSQQDCRDQNDVNDPPAQAAGTISLAKNEGINFSTGSINGPGIQSGSGTWQATATITETRRNYVSWVKGTNGCKYQTATRTFVRTLNYKQASSGTSNGVIFKAWRYKPVEFDIKQLKSGDTWKSDYKYTAATGNNYTTATYVWDGCIEERATVRQASYSPIPSGAKDLDIDDAPDGDDADHWKPALDDIIYPRKVDYNNNSAWSQNEITTFTNYSGEAYDCVAQAQPLRTYADPSDFESYVDSMKPLGNTYHDIGMVWGARLLSPTGMWRSTNEFTPRGGAIQRHLIFMTDGDACTNEINYQAYGLAWHDRRETDPSVVPTSGCSADKVPGTLTDQVAAKTAALCSAVKNMKDTTLWVIWFGDSQPSIEASMRACASPDRFFAARDSASLQTTFRQIASQISQLRVTN